MKHIKIMSGRKTIYEDWALSDCYNCPLFCVIGDATEIETCGLLDKPLIRGGMELFDPIPKECPLQDVPGDITSKSCD